MKMDIHTEARGKWRGILATLGIPQQFLKDKHGPCPMCGGSDRYRWDNKDGTGSYICGQCGAGSGIDLLMNYRGIDFRQAVDDVRGVLGIVPKERIPQGMTDDRRRQLLRDLWKSCQPIQSGDVVSRYLTARGLAGAYPADLLTCERCYFAEGVYYPAMVAMVRDADGKPVTMHRTYLGEGRKAAVDEPRRIMPGKVPEGACIRLGDVQDEIGIAEGIETALAAMQRHGLPVWSAINSTMLANWIAPAGVKSVRIFGDNDPKFGGQAAAYRLAHRLAVKGLAVSVEIPERPGTDWADMGAAA